MAPTLLTWPPGTISRDNILRRLKYCGAETRCVHTDPNCCCKVTPNCCPCPTPWILNGVITQISGDPCPKLDGDTFTMEADPDEPVCCPEKWTQTSPPVGGTDCEITFELNCSGKPPVYTIVANDGTGFCYLFKPTESTGGSTPEICEVEAKIVECCKGYGTGTFRLVFEMRAEELGCCGTEEGKVYLFEVTLTAQCPTLEECSSIGGGTALSASSIKQPDLDVSSVPKDIFNWLNGGNDESEKT